MYVAICEKIPAELDLGGGPDAFVGVVPPTLNGGMGILLPLNGAANFEWLNGGLGTERASQPNLGGTLPSALRTGALVIMSGALGTALAPALGGALGGTMISTSGPTTCAGAWPTNPGGGSTASSP